MHVVRMFICRAGKIVRLRQKLVDMADSVKGLFGAKKQQDNAVEKMERLKVCRMKCFLVESPFVQFSQNNVVSLSYCTNSNNLHRVCQNGMHAFSA